MTYRTFLRALRRTKARWGYSGYAYIRCARGLCPIEAVARGAGAGEIQKGDVWEAVRFLGMDTHSAYRVMHRDSIGPSFRWARGHL